MKRDFQITITFFFHTRSPQKIVDSFGRSVSKSRWRNSETALRDQFRNPAGAISRKLYAISFEVPLVQFQDSSTRLVSKSRWRDFYRLDIEFQI